MARRPPLPEKLASLTEFDTNGGCWLFSGQLTRTGYGLICTESKKRQAHRVAFELARGAIPAGLCVCHHCDVRACVNPDHLWLGTHAQNMRDQHDKGRGSTTVALGEGHPRAKLTEPLVRLIRASEDSAASLARTLGVTSSAVRSVRGRRTWGHVQ
ncbi:HNH endonuclease signature motif containing protein [Methylocaldum sp.]|uniref:HNH endonuclease signature motif containing protein n=1 Tax=Methylocaldum sp. TaxID=1969727 RepID=UPI002D26D8EB|nr:HNH endonuclease signature motif containing protein [Methylocaldum sp.]HYE38198.1 HNH endonuclease signature motif containing protein [Methylocaldum sp.]